jgi:uncharacterized membrane protein
MTKVNYNWDEKLGPILYLNIGKRTLGLCLFHRIKDRSIKFFGIEKYLCSRCLGILLGGLSAVILNYFGFYLTFFWALILSIPILIDGSVQYFGIRLSNNIIRLITGYLFGFSLNFIGAVL